MKKIMGVFFLQKALLIMINCGGFFSKKVRFFLEKLSWFFLAKCAYDHY